MDSPFRKLTCRPGGEKGSILVLIALSLVVLLSLVAVVVDFGFMYSAKAQLQNAADAAALAGVVRLDGTSNTLQANARSEAVLFASKNMVAGAPVVLNGNSGNSDTGDVQVGNWDPTLTPKFLTTRLPINAVKVVAQRSADKGNAINTILGKILNISTVDIGVQATASLSLSTPPLLLCAKAPGLPITNFDLSPNLPVGTENGTGWTLFRPSTSVPASELKDASYDQFSDYCSKPCIGTTNGNIQPVLDILKATFDAKKDNSTVPPSWKVPIPIVDGTCTLNDGTCPALPTSCTDPDTTPPSQGCPPGKQGNTELYHITGWAEATVIAVNDAGNPRGFVASVGELIACDANPLGRLGKPRLVQ